MNKIELSAAGVDDTIQAIQQALGGKIEEDCDVINLKIAATAGEGNIKGVNFQNGLGLLSFHCKLQEEIHLIYHHKTLSPIRFIFCVRGSIRHVFTGESAYELEELRGSITAGPTTSAQTLVLPADTPLTVNLLEINRKEYIERIDCELHTLPGTLAEIFQGNPTDPVFIYTGDYSLSIAQSIQEINYNKLSGLAKRTYLESKALELFSQQMQQYEDDQKADKKRQVLRKVEVDLIAKARDILLGNLQNPPTITELARQTGLNEQKLKKGFKLLFDTTINKYLLNERMEHAKVLLAEGSRSIKEVAAVIGFSNNGYFSGKFKEKFGVLPSDYLKALRQEKAPYKAEKAVA